MYIWYISTKRPDLTPIGRIRLKFDLRWPWSENISSEFLRKFLVKTYVYWVHIDYSTRINPNSAILLKFDLWWPFIGHDIYKFGISKNESSRRAFSNIPKIILLEFWFELLRVNIIFSGKEMIESKKSWQSSGN